MRTRSHTPRLLACLPSLAALALALGLPGSADAGQATLASVVITTPKTDDPRGKKDADSERWRPTFPPMVIELGDKDQQPAPEALLEQQLRDDQQRALVWRWLFRGSIGSILLFGLVLGGVSRARRDRHNVARWRRAVAEGHAEPPRRYPVIDPARCIGCGFCGTSCKRGALGLVQSRVSLLEPASCVGCGICARKCPVSAAQMHGPLRPTKGRPTKGRATKSRAPKAQAMERKPVLA